MDDIEKSFVSVTEFAKAVGVTYHGVLNAVKAGRLDSVVRKTPEGKIEIELELGKKVFVDSRRRAVTNKSVDDTSDVATHERNLKKHNAELARLKVERVKGMLVSSELVKIKLFKMARQIRDGLLNIPDRISAEVAAETNQFKVHKRMTDEIKLALEVLSDQLEIEATELEELENTVDSLKIGVKNEPVS